MVCRVRHARGIIDTSTVIILPRLDDPAVLPDEPLITAITLAELTVVSAPDVNLSVKVPGPFNCRFANVASPLIW